MDSSNGSHSCTICNKKYSSYKSLWNHNKKYHIDCVIPNNTNVILSNTNVTPNSNAINYNCKYCNKEFKLRQYRWKHEKICKHKEKLVLVNPNELVELKNKIKELEDKIVTNASNNTNNGTINNNNNQTNITNNIKVTFGEEEIDMLSVKNKKKILNSGYLSLIKLIEMVHLNKDYPQFQNIKIHNLKDKFAKIYDQTTKSFITVTKKDSIDSLICCRTLDLKSIYEEYNKEDNNFHHCVSKLIEKLESCTDEKPSLEFYKNQSDDIVLLIYNNTKVSDIEL